jgi:sulfate adenylyltransferase subunit 1
VLNHEVDISRGDLIVSADAPATVAKRVKARWCGWISGRSNASRRYLLKHTSHTGPPLFHRSSIAPTSARSREAAETLEMNGIGVVNIDFAAADGSRSLRTRIARPALSS